MDVQAALDCDSEAWNLFSISGQGVHFEAWWSHIFQEVQAGTWIAYAIRDLASQKIVSFDELPGYKARSLLREGRSAPRSFTRLRDPAR